VPRGLLLPHWRGVRLRRVGGGVSHGLPRRNMEPRWRIHLPAMRPGPLPSGGKPHVHFVPMRGWLLLPFAVGRAESSGVPLGLLLLGGRCRPRPVPGRQVQLSRGTDRVRRLRRGQLLPRDRVADAVPPGHVQRWRLLRGLLRGVRWLQRGVLCICLGRFLLRVVSRGLLQVRGQRFRYGESLRSGLLLRSGLFGGAVPCGRLLHRGHRRRHLYGFHCWYHACCELRHLGEPLGCKRCHLCGRCQRGHGHCNHAVYFGRPRWRRQLLGEHQSERGCHAVDRRGHRLPRRHVQRRRRLHMHRVLGRVLLCAGQLVWKHPKPLR